MLEQPGRNKAYFNTGGMVKIRFIPPRTNSELYVFFRPGQSMVNFFVSGGQSTPITLFYALDGHRILLVDKPALPHIASIDKAASY